MATTNYIVPRTPAEWERWRPVFTRYYMDQNLPLPKVMKLMEDEHRVKARYARVSLERHLLRLPILECRDGYSVLQYLSSHALAWFKSI